MSAALCRLVGWLSLAFAFACAYSAVMLARSADPFIAFFPTCLVVFMGWASAECFGIGRAVERRQAAWRAVERANREAVVSDLAAAAARRVLPFEAVGECTPAELEAAARALYEAGLGDLECVWWANAVGQGRMASLGESLVEIGQLWISLGSAVASTPREEPLAPTPAGVQEPVGSTERPAPNASTPITPPRQDLAAPVTTDRGW